MITCLIIINLVNLFNTQSIYYPEVRWSEKNVDGLPCIIPDTMRGKWYVETQGAGMKVSIDRTSMESFGECEKMRFDDSFSVYRNTFLLTTPKCKTCISLIYRSKNILEFKKLDCINSAHMYKTMNESCHGVDEMEFTTMFAVTPTPVNCRPSIEGVYRFAFRYGIDMGFCDSNLNRISACQKPGTHFASENERFYMNYSRCDSVVDSIEDDPYATSNKKGKDRFSSAHITYSCLGQWELTNNNLYFAVANLGESQEHLKYRCFMTRRDQPFYMVKSKSATCSELRHARDGPEQLKLTPMEFARVTPTCHFPQDFSGAWINTANYDSKFVINSTHLYEENYQNQRLIRRTYYVCKESRGTSYLTTRLSYSGCQVDHVCWHFLLHANKQQNVILYRSSLASLDGKFGQVCLWSNFPSQRRWKYSTLLAANPTPIPCPIQGRYVFTQRGQIPLVDRILGGVTQNPQVQVDCNTVEAELQICSGNDKVINVDVARCASLDALGKPMGEFDRFDYKMSCIGYWKEDTQSHLITYDENDSSSKYRCWVFQRTQIGTIIMSRSIQSYCSVNQVATSWNASQGASLRLKLIESERQFDHCPMYFDPGDLDDINVGQSREVILLNSGTTLLKNHDKGTVKLTIISLSLSSILIFSRKIFLI